ncbi:hypothetical protein Bca52824_027463 [Brassica carinata]|uniref:WAT1-related protein n=1 Tax=Brassica carinata TaxID=52824 RepID=A0A8X7VAI9_BRACI|nr:hypothetical protein Bca52824_027463 [Brassica carinata]
MILCRSSRLTSVKSPNTSFYLHASRYLQATPHSLSFLLGGYQTVSGNLDIKSVMRGTREETVAWRYFHRDVLPFAAMFAVECSTVGSNTLYKAATLRGLNFYVFIFYSYAASTLVLLPLSLIFGRSKKLPSAKSPLFFKMFLLGLFGCRKSSPTLSSAMSNLTPAFTFTLAVIFRMEQVVLRSSATQAKIIGGVLSISGALVVVLYKGPKVLSAASFTTSSSPTSSLHQHLTSSESSWIVGGLLLASQFILVSVWYIVQTLVMEVYPEEITVVFFYYLFATLVSAPVCLLAERNLTSWVIKPDITLAAIVYSGVFASLFSVLTHTWGLHLKGPVYVSLFRPLSIAIAVAMGAIFLSDALHLGSVIGSVILCFGFYTVIWGKAREDSTKTVADSEHCSPLLLTHIVEDEGLSLR